MSAALAVLTLLAACSRDKESQTGAADRAPGAQIDAGNRDKIGRIYHYVRSNIDGTEREDVYVFRKRIDFLEVYKMRSKCTNAALVTAEMDMAKGYATKLTGGRLQPDAKHEEFAFLTYDSAKKEIDARIELPDRAPLTQTLKIEHEPWHLYDFDLASLTVMTPHLEAKADFKFDLALVIADPDRPEFLVNMGEAQAAFRGEETHNGEAAYRYSLGGPAFGSFGGNIWLDADEGHILDAETGFPNHVEYRDFKLKLQGVDDGGEEAWTTLLKAHFEGCSDPSLP